MRNIIIDFNKSIKFAVGLILVVMSTFIQIFIYMYTVRNIVQNIHTYMHAQTSIPIRTRTGACILIQTGTRTCTLICMCMHVYVLSAL